MSSVNVSSFSSLKSGNIVDIIVSEHRLVDSLFSQFQSRLGNDAKQLIANQIIRELSMHAAKEEMVLYPTIKSKLGVEGAKVVEHSLEEHQGIKNVLYELDCMKVSDAGYEEKMQMVIKEVSHHVKEEERDVLPKLNAALPMDEKIKLGAEFVDAENRAPPRPHPSGPASYPINVAANVFSKVIDENIRGASDTRKTSSENL